MSEAAEITCREPIRHEVYSLKWGRDVWLFSATAKINDKDYEVAELIDLGRYPMNRAKHIFRLIARKAFKKASKTT